MITKVCIGIPTINRADLLREALQTYAMNGWLKRDIFIIDNGKQSSIGHDILMRDWAHAFHVFSQSKNIGVAASWNALAEMAFKNGYTHIWLLNDDVIPNSNPEQIEQFLSAYPMDFYTGKGFYSFILPETTFRAIGNFDENFWPAYYEDTDYSHRLYVAGKKTLETDILKPEVLRTSKSGEKDPRLYENIAKNRAYYIEKWGGQPGQETKR